jgi:hypothetical protein
VACLVQSPILLRLNPEIGATYHYLCEFQMAWQSREERHVDRRVTRLSLTSWQAGSFNMNAETLPANRATKTRFSAQFKHPPSRYEFQAKADGLFLPGLVTSTDYDRGVYDRLALGIVVAPSGFSLKPVSPGAFWDRLSAAYVSLPPTNETVTIRSTYLGVVLQQGLNVVEIQTTVVEKNHFELKSQFMLDSGMCLNSKINAGAISGTAKLVCIKHADKTVTLFR